MNTRPSDDEYAEYFARYVTLVPEADVMSVLGQQPAELTRIAAQVSAEGERFRYGAGKWSIREVFGHMTDAERVFGYRGFCISRGEQAPLPAFDENIYVARSPYDGQRLADLLDELIAIRRGNLTFLHRLQEQEWELRGTASNRTVSVRALAFIMAGHVRHHLNGLRANYGLGPVA
jgi:uncharacterized damage-inducible protein DinB